MRHAKLSTTQRYIYLNEDTMKEAVNAVAKDIKKQ